MEPLHNANPPCSLQVRLADLEKGLLEALATAEGDLLEDTSLIERLSETKATAAEIQVCPQHSSNLHPSRFSSVQGTVNPNAVVHQVGDDVLFCTEQLCLGDTLYVMCWSACVLPQTLLVLQASNFLQQASVMLSGTGQYRTPPYPLTTLALVIRDTSFANCRVARGIVACRGKCSEIAFSDQRSGSDTGPPITLAICCCHSIALAAEVEHDMHPVDLCCNFAQCIL